MIPIRILVLSGTAFALAGCGTGGADGGDTTEAPIVATTTIWADITSNVLCGEEVTALIPTGSDPHTFEPSLRDRELLERSSVVVTNGAGLEVGVTDLLDVASNVIDISRHVDLDDGDPHIWHDPRRVAQAVALIDSAVASPGSRTCADSYAEQLDRLDRDIIELFAPIPRADRVIVTSHDSLGYFAERYGIEVVGTVIPSTDTLAQTSAADLAALAGLIEDRGVRTIFTEAFESTADADALAARLDVQVVPLVTDALTDDPATDTYLEMMYLNATLIAGTLVP